MGISCLGLLTFAVPAHTQTTTALVPQGVFTVNIAAGTSTARTTSVLSFPLQSAASYPGEMAGVITGVTANTLTNSNAGWMAGQLSQAASPSLIQITSGMAAGRYFLLSSSTINTMTTVTLDASEVTNLTTLGIVAGTDTYQIVPADTISSLFGTPATTGILGAANENSGSADQVQVYSTPQGWTTYYYDTTFSSWFQTGATASSGAVVVRPDAAIIYSRLATTSLALPVMGQVPSLTRQSAVSNSGTTTLAAYWPVGLTLATSNVQKIPGWMTGTSSTTADLVQIYTTAHGWTQYYNNGTNWIQVGPPINSNNVAIPAGAGIILIKQGSATGQNVLTQRIPFSL